MFHTVAVGVSETTTINVTLPAAQSNIEVTVHDVPPLVRSDGAELASSIDARTVETLPLPTRNLLQLLTLAPGVTAPLTNNSAMGRNSPNVSVNGSRVTQNSYQINGVDASDIPCTTSQTLRFATSVPRSTCQTMPTISYGKVPL